MGMKAKQKSSDPPEPFAFDRETCQALLAAASDDESRPALHYVHITGEYAEATTGHVLIRIPHKMGTATDVDLLLHRDALKHVKASPKGQHLYVAPEAGRVWVGKAPPLGSLGVLTELTEQDYLVERDDDHLYPNTDAVWPKESKADKPADLGLGSPILQALATFGKLRGGGLDGVHLAVPKNGPHGYVDVAVPFTILTGGEREIRGLAMPMRIVR